MIRINLLGVAKPAARMTGPSEGIAPEAIFIPGLLLVILVVVTGFVYWYWTSQIAKLQQDLARQQAEKARLVGIAEQNKRYQAQITQLALQKQRIDALNNNRVGPAQLMSTLGVLSDRSNELYLVSLTSSKDNRLVLDGRANSIDAIANFVAALQQSGTFSDVQLRQSFEDDQGKRVSFKFNLDCIYNQSAGAALTTPAAQHGSAPAAARQAGL